MRRPATALLAILALTWSIAPAPAAVSEPTASVEGLILDVEGRPATGYGVHLIDDAGQPVDRSVTGDDGVFSFTALPAGQYAMGIEDPEGRVAAVSGPPLRLADGELARRDLKLMEVAPGAAQEAVDKQGLGSWWAGLSPAAKAWTIVAIVVVAGITWAALDSSDDSPTEPPASKFNVQP